MAGTLKQKAVVQNLLENTGKSVRQAMKEEGYKPGSYDNPQQLTRSKGWQELMEEYLPEEKLAQLHREQLGATRTYFYNKKKYDLPDNDARLRALNYGYKIHGKYKPVTVRVQTFAGWSPQELEDYAERGIVPGRYKDEVQ